MEDMERRVNRYPFSAIVGQPLLKRSLIYNAVDETIGGVLIFGQRGIAKSTAVRALADLLPDLSKPHGWTSHPRPGPKGRNRRTPPWRTGMSMTVGETLYLSNSGLNNQKNRDV